MAPALKVLVNSYNPSVTPSLEERKRKFTLISSRKQAELEAVKAEQILHYALFDEAERLADQLEAAREIYQNPITRRMLDLGDAEWEAGITAIRAVREAATIRWGDLREREKNLEGGAQ